MLKRKTHIVIPLIMGVLFSFSLTVPTVFPALVESEKTATQTYNPDQNSGCSNGYSTQMHSDTTNISDCCMNDGNHMGLIEQATASSTSSTSPTFIKSPITNPLEKKGFLEVGIDMLKREMVDKPESNVIISPQGLYQVLNMIRVGAIDRTACLLHSAIGGDFRPSLNVSSYNALITPDCITAHDDYLIQLAALNGELINVCCKDENACKRVAAKVNKSCHEKTNGMISEALNYQALLRNNLAAIFFNAIYFNKKWQKPFSESQLEQFNITTERTSVVHMMKSTDIVNYFTHEKFSAIALPYEKAPNHPSVFMVVVLPQLRSGALNIETSELALGIREVTSSKRDEMVNISFPAFKFKTKEIDLKSHLNNMGLMELEQFMNIPFRNLQGNLKLDEIKQKVMIKVDKDGTQAAAVTQSVQSDGPLGNIPSFNCNWPFLYFIVDKSNRAEPDILFSGLVTDPTKEE